VAALGGVRVSEETERVQAINVERSSHEGILSHAARG
jgi:hypothetical protein